MELPRALPVGLHIKLPLYYASVKKEKRKCGSEVESKNRMVFLNQKGNNIADKWIREVSKRSPLQKF
jgi:hypothetical protein